MNIEPMVNTMIRTALKVYTELLNLKEIKSIEIAISRRKRRFFFLFGLFRQNAKREINDRNQPLFE